MSLESVRAFWQKAGQDRSLQAQLEALQGRDRQAIGVAVVQAAAAAGFTFTVADYEAALKEEAARLHRAGELKEEQLQQVSAASGAYCGKGV
jgi:predicted ribosomally synthesized peptide with nif11-like leader